MDTNKLHLVETTHAIPVKQERRKRLAARHISVTMRLYIVSLFDRLESHDAVADELRREFPGITGRTIAEVLDLHQIRKMPAMERSMAQLRLKTARRA